MSESATKARSLSDEQIINRWGFDYYVFKALGAFRDADYAAFAHFTSIIESESEFVYISFSATPVHTRQRSLSLCVCVCVCVSRSLLFLCRVRSGGETRRRTQRHDRQAALHAVPVPDQQRRQAR